jgi:naphtho-gamma-pyrone polyketide synthase
VGSVILKRLEDAEADKDPILGVIVGTNTNHCGQTDSITRPHEGDQASVFKRIMRYADVDPLDVSYVEMHGTGTQAGDATEMNSVLSVFVPEYKRTTVQPARPLYIGSSKANIGHAESASGVSSLIKVLMMMKHSEIPRHCGIKTRINHNYPLDLAQRGVHIAKESIPWRRQDAVSGKRAVFLNNFSAAGGNTAILLEDAPVPQSTAEKDPRPVHVVTLTAKSPKSLVSNINSLVSFLETKGSSVSLAALSYTTTARRMHHPYRVAVSGSDAGSLLSALKSRAAESQAALADLKPITVSAKKRPRVVFMFSGQGTLYAELGKSLFVTNATFRASILRLNRLAQTQGFPAFLGLVDGSTANDDLQAVGAIVSQLAISCVQIALFELWKSWDVAPAAVVGHSLGEYAALHAAGVLSVADVIYLVGTRAALLEACCTPGTHIMLAVKGSPETVEQLLQDHEGCEWTCANQPSGHVIAGPENKISEVERVATDMGIKTVRLNVSFAFHSAQVEPILAEFEHAAAQGVVYHPPTVPVLSPLLAKLVPAGDSDTLNASYLTAACRGRVDFTGALAAAAAAPADDGGLGLGAAERTIWLEIGSHPVCSGMVKGTLGSHSKTVATLRQQEDAYQTLTAAVKVLYLAGIEVNWNEYHRDFPAAQEVLELPMYAWDLKNYWIQYRNDFCLTKGDDMVPQLAIEAPTVLGVVPKYLSPGAQQVVEESHGADQSSLVVESDIFDPRLLPVLQGHLVNGAALCPSVSLTQGDE